jgi:hypothetical protein
MSRWRERKARVNAYGSMFGAVRPLSSTSSGEVRSCGSCIVGAVFRFFPFFLASECGEVEEGVGTSGHLCAASVEGVGVEDPVAVAEKAAPTWLFDGLLTVEVVAGAGLLVFSFGPVVVDHRRD